jgi:hypothetical protein
MFRSFDPYDALGRNLNNSGRQLKDYRASLQNPQIAQPPALRDLQASRPRSPRHPLSTKCPTAGTCLRRVCSHILIALGLL